MPLYEIRLDGRLDQRWSSWFGELSLATEADGTTTLRGRIADQAELHGLLAKVRDLGVPLLSLVSLSDDSDVLHTTDRASAPGRASDGLPHSG